MIHFKADYTKTVNPFQQKKPTRLADNSVRTGGLYALTFYRLPYIFS